MEPRDFDTLTRALAAAKSRRGLLGGLAALFAGVRATAAQDGCPPGQTRNRKGDCSCPAGTDACPDGCFNRKKDPNNCGRCGAQCLPGATCVKGECRCPAGGCSTPCPGISGADPITGALWTVCRADAGTAWVTHATFEGGSYHPTLICQGLGYAGYDLFGNTYGSVCGYLEGPTSCDAQGQEIYDGDDSCTPEDILCVLPTWRCVSAI